MMQTAAMAAWVPDSGAEDVGGSKAAAARRAGGAAAVEAELDALQRSMLASWQGRQPTPTPLAPQVAGWQGQLEALESRVQVCCDICALQQHRQVALRGIGFCSCERLQPTSATMLRSVPLLCLMKLCADM